MALLLPDTLDEDTVPKIIAALDGILYPRPTPGLEIRIAVLLTLTGLCVLSSSSLLRPRPTGLSAPAVDFRRSILLGILYLGLHYQSTVERPRRRCLWLVRRVERLSGRFLVIKCVAPGPPPSSPPSALVSPSSRPCSSRRRSL